MAKAKKQKQKEMTEKEKHEMRARRQETHKSKLADAMARLTSKFQTFGDDAMLDEYELCAYLGRSVQWARLHRINNGEGGGPLLPYRKIGAAVRYRLGDIKTAA